MSFSFTNYHKKGNKIILFSIIFIVFITGVGFFGLRWQKRKIDDYIQQKMTLQAYNLAQALGPYFLKQLTFSPSDRDLMAYHRIETQLKGYSRLIENNGIYILGLKDGQLCMGPNIFEESFMRDDFLNFLRGKIITEEEHKKLLGGQVIVLGPFEGSSKKVFTALAPISLKGDQSFPILLGIDVLYETYRQQAWFPIKILLILGGIFVFFFIVGAALNVFWSRRNKSFFQHIEVIITALLGLLLTGTITLMAYNYEYILRDNIYLEFCHRLSIDIIHSFEAIQKNLMSISRFFESSDFINPQEFSVFTSPFKENSFGICYGWVDDIKHAHLKEYEKIFCDEISPNFMVWEWSQEHLPSPVSARSFYFPLRYVSCSEESFLPAGFDLGSNPHIKDLLDEIKWTHLLTATGHVPFDTVNGQSQVLFVLEPAFKKSQNQLTFHSTREMMGFAMAGIDLSTFLETAITPPFAQDDSLLAIHLVDLHKDSWGKILASKGVDVKDSCQSNINAPLKFFSQNITYPLFMFGRPFALVIHPSQAFYQAFPFWRTWVVAIICLIVTLLLTLFIAFLKNREARLERVIEAQTNTLQEREKKYRLLAENSVDTIWLLDHHFTIRYVSYSVKELLGYAPSELYEKSISHVVKEDDFKNIVNSFKSLLASQNTQEIITNEIDITRKDKTTVSVEIRAKILVDKEGNPEGIQGIARDITEKKQREKQLQARLKELACISAIRQEILQNLSENEFCICVIDHVKRAMEYPEEAEPIIELKGRTYPIYLEDKKYRNFIKAVIKSNNETLGRLLVRYPKGKSFLLPEDQEFVHHVAENIGLWHEFRQAWDQEEHTKQILLAIRNVNQLIVKENDKITLLEKVCANLTETMGYDDAWITLIDEKKPYRLIKTSMLRVCDFKNHFNLETNNPLPPCIADIINNKTFHFYNSAESACVSCIFSNGRKDLAIYSAPLKHQHLFYGVLTVAVPQEFSTLAEGKGLFVEVAEDIGFALYKIDLEKRREESEKEILKNLREKEILLQEVHHRVKNNLNVISSLLKLQARTIKTKKDALEAFQNSSNRVLAMALVHRKLYDTKNFDSVDLNSYVTNLVHQLETATVPENTIHIHTDIEEICLNMNKAIPCGLILNELITNALKHAFHGRASGDLSLSIHTQNDKTVKISVSDDGIGMPKNINFQKIDSLGLHLVELLTKQIEGTFHIESEIGKGTTFIITFPLEEYNQ